MIDVEKIIDNPYEKIGVSFSEEMYNGLIECAYRPAFELFKVDIKCSIEDKKHCCGSVSMRIMTEKFLNEGIISFEYLEVPMRISNRGVGSILMSKVFNIAKDFAKYYNMSINKIYIEGWLSSVDYQNGNWNNSLPFYQGIARKNDVDVFFRGRDSKKKYTDWREYMMCEANKDGDIIFIVLLEENQAIVS